MGELGRNAFLLTPRSIGSLTLHRALLLDVCADACPVLERFLPEVIHASPKILGNIK